MKLIAIENFQFRGFRRAGVTLTVPAGLLKTEIEKGKHPKKIRGEERWLSGLVQHTTPANEATAKFISECSGEKVEPAELEQDEADDSEEIRALWAEFETLGKGYDKRWKLEALRNRLIKAKKEAGE